MLPPNENWTSKEGTSLSYAFTLSSCSDSLETCQISNITNIKEQLEEIECLLGLVGSETFLIFP